MTGEHEPAGDHRAEIAGERSREVVRRWRRALVTAGFSEEQAARLIFAKLLYLRGRLRAGPPPQ